MLVLSRKLDQKIIINDDLIIKVKGFHYHSGSGPLWVRLGFEGDADKYVIDREEVYLNRLERQKNE